MNTLTTKWLVVQKKVLMILATRKEALTAMRGKIWQMIILANHISKRLMKMVMALQIIMLWTQMVTALLTNMLQILMEMAKSTCFL